jgi:hypothetical protein
VSISAAGRHRRQLCAAAQDYRAGAHFMTQTQIVIEDFKAVRRNSLLGFARVRMPSGTIFHDVTVHFRDVSPGATLNGKGGAAPPSAVTWRFGQEARP